MTYSYTLKTGSILLAATILWSSPIQAAQECKIPPTCMELGYTFLESDCTGKPMLRCPFNPKRVYCVTNTCARGTEWCEAQGKCIESCKGYNKQTALLIPHCLVSNVKATCTDCEGNLYYKCISTGETIEKPDGGITPAPTYNCELKQIHYKSISDKGTNIIRDAYNCGNYISWRSGQFPIAVGDTCLTWMNRIKSEIADHNNKCPSNQVTDNLKTNNCYTCCEGSGTKLGILSSCVGNEVGGDNILVPQL